MYREIQKCSSGSFSWAAVAARRHQVVDLGNGVRLTVTVTDSDTPTVQPVVGNHFTTMFQFVTPKALRAQ